jgi:hypothetical protein
MVKNRNTLPGLSSRSLFAGVMALAMHAAPIAANAADTIEKHVEDRLYEKAEEKAGAAVAVPKQQPKSWQLFRADDYLALPVYEQELYVSGLNDAYNWSYSGGFERMKWLAPCVHGRKAPQLTAMFRKWLERYPERWHEPAAKLFPFAIFSLCRAARQPLATGSGGKKNLGK